MIERLDIAEWRAYDALHPAPTFFARPAWAQALELAYPRLRAHPVRIRLRGGARVLIPLVKAAGGTIGWRELIGTPLGGYTCALHDDGTVATAAEFSEAIGMLRRECDVLACTPWPFAPAPLVRGGVERSYSTSVIDLANGVEEALSGLDGGSRRMAGQAERRGVTCAPSHSAMAATTYYEMLRISAERWGIGQPHFPKPLLDALISTGEGDVEIWLAEHLSHPIAGGVVFYGSQELFFWSAAMRSEYSRLRPSNALNVALIRAASERGLRWYNLGASEGLPGVERFKRGLGAATIGYSSVHFKRPVYTLYSWMRSTIPERRHGEADRSEDTLT
jgi:CelD/BcsL family acetyltransferase involved in cellulose biosynthesis